MWYELMWWDVEKISEFCVSDHIISHPTKSHILPTPSHPTVAVSEAHKKRREAKAKAGMDWVGGLGS